jgi:predicted hotdog family 3-hydroxylacyl-ACP dehydratase
MNASTLVVTKERIATMIPHAGNMCLLDGVARWNSENISCVSTSHRKPDNPLRVQGRLSAISGIEYAAQAMALHGALTGGAGGVSRAGYLASVRDVVCRRRDLDGLTGDLIVDAQQLLAEGRRVLYEFRLQIGTTEVLSGRAAVVLDISNVAG